MKQRLNDAIKAKDLFYDELAAFRQLDDELKQVYYELLNDKREFRGFFLFLGHLPEACNLEQLITRRFENEICADVDLRSIVAEHPVALSYCLSLLNSFIANKKTYSITPAWVLKNYPEVERIMFRLRNKPCLRGCVYCDQALDVHKALKRFFGFDAYRTYGAEPLQE